MVERGATCVRNLAAVGRCLALAVLLAACQRHPASLVSMVVEEDEPGERPLALNRLAADHSRMHPVLVGDHQPQRAVCVDDVDPLGGDFPHVARRLLPHERRCGEHDEDQQRAHDVGLQEPQLTAK